MLQERLEKISNNLDSYFLINDTLPLPQGKEVLNFVLDIEASPNADNEGVTTYSIALMSCDNDKDICFQYNNIELFMEQLLHSQARKINIYVHNLLYDIKPFIIHFIEKYGNNPLSNDYYLKEVLNPFTKKKQKLKYVYEGKKNIEPKPYQYSWFMKKGQLYSCTLYGNEVKKLFGSKGCSEINFYDTYKIFPFNLQKASNDFINLSLPKDGLDYDKIRNLDDELTKEEKQYIYNDVFSLSYIVKKMIINGFYIDDKLIKYTKRTNSSQSLADYKLTLLDDYLNNKNAFVDKTVKEYAINQELLDNRYWKLTDNQKEEKSNCVFNFVFPELGYFSDSWLRHSYFGGLTTVDNKNVRKYSNYENKKGIVLDVNSLYPFILENMLMPYGYGHYRDIPYSEMNEEFKISYPLYVQEIEIYDFEIKKNKMPFIQVKDNIYFNGVEILESNIDRNGQKRKIKLRLCNPLFELLFENYNVKAYRLGGHMAFTGANDLFKNYLSFWKKVKQNESGCNRAIAKLRQNALYGKFGSSGDNEITNINVDNHTFNVEHTHDFYCSQTLYLPIATFVTSYAKAYLIKAINENKDRFLYCDTDSLHLFGNLEDVKGLNIDDKIYGSWKHEMTFDDFIYIGAKRYAEKDIKTNKWDIKCCGLTDNIMKKVDDINVFGLCEFSNKELKDMKLYTNKDSVYYYFDENCTKKVKGLIKSKKAKIVENGTLIVETPYRITNNFYN